MSEKYYKCKNCEKDCEQPDLILMHDNTCCHINSEEECSDACWGCLCDNPEPEKRLVKKE